MAISIGNKIKKIRKDNNLSQAEFAEKIQASRRAIVDWENEKYTPQMDSLKNICEVFNIDLNYFVDETKVSKAPTIEQQTPVQPTPVDTQVNEASNTAAQVLPKINVYNNLFLDKNEADRQRKLFKKATGCKKYYEWVSLLITLCLDGLFLGLDAAGTPYIWLTMIPVTIIGIKVHRVLMRKHEADFDVKMKEYFTKPGMLLLCPLYPLYFKKENERSTVIYEDKVILDFDISSVNYFYLLANYQKINGLFEINSFSPFIHNFAIEIYFRDGKANKISIPFCFEQKKSKTDFNFIASTTAMNLNKMKSMVK